MSDPPTPLTTDRQIDLCQKVYGEVSNYDRHYSTVRATLTALVVTIGLSAAAEPIKAMFNATGRPAACGLHFFPALALQAQPYLPTLLLFALAVAVSMYFQRLTYSCAVLERELERHIIGLAGGVPPAQRRALPGVQLTWLGFRHDLAAVHAKVPWLHADAMTRLLLSGITGFLAFVLVVTLRGCGFWTAWYWPLFWFAAPAVAVWFLARLVNRISG